MKVGSGRKTHRVVTAWVVVVCETSEGRAGLQAKGVDQLASRSLAHEHSMMGMRAQILGGRRAPEHHLRLHMHRSEGSLLDVSPARQHRSSEP